MSYPDAIRFAYGKTLSGVITKTEPWDKIVSVFTKPHRVYPDKLASTQSPNILGGPTDNRGKEAKNVLGRSLITLDYDDLGDVTVDDIDFALDMLGYAAVAYTTFSHRTERAGGGDRLRVIVPLAEEISKEAYPAAARALADVIGHPCAKESFSAAYVMFLPSCMEGYEDQAWSKAYEGQAFPVDEAWGKDGSAERSDDASDDDFLLDIVYEPLDFTDAEVDKALELLPAEGLDYDDWLRVGLALFHQYRGDTGDAGFGRWLAWSKKSSKHDPKLMRIKWKSSGGRSRPVTMASVMARIGGVAVVREALERDSDCDEESSEVLVPERQGGALALVDKFSQAAHKIEGLADYERLKQALLRVSERRLGSDYRGMIAEEVYTAWGKGAGLTKGDIKKAFMPERLGVTRVESYAGEIRSNQPLTEEECWSEERPEWLRGWVFDEADAEFVNVGTGQGIKRESFRMKFDRMPECIEHETDSVGLAARTFAIPTVAGRMYWPGNARVFQMERSGLSYLNSWIGGGVDAVPEGSFEIGDDSMEGQACAVFLRHLELTVRDDRERALMLDWMAWVYNNPGSRVRWALLLWGIEGNGKSYFHRVLTLLMGRDSRTVAASTIEERFTDWAEGCRLIGIEEIRVSGTNKWRTLDKMKPFISNDEIQVEGKGKAAKVVPNFASYMLFTNHADAIPVTDGDRRYFVIFTRHRTKQELLDQHGGEEGVGRYFQTLFDVSLAGIAGIGRLLASHQYSGEFDPHGRAPDSSGKAEMRALHISEDDEALADALERYSGPFINDKIIDLTKLQDDCEFGTGIELPKTSVLAHKLVEMGFSKGGRVKARGKNRTFWYQSNKISLEDAMKAMRSGVGESDPDIPF
jgi:hypothetical protein